MPWDPAMSAVPPPPLTDSQCAESLSAPSQRTALRLLLQAAERAERSGMDCWQFAVELRVLREAGLSHTDLRQLRIDSIVEAAVENTRAEDPTRKFSPLSNLYLPETACFILTGPGRQRLLGLPLHSDIPPAVPADGVSLPATRPHWDAEQRLLKFSGLVVKQFLQRAPCQERILEAFEEMEWASLIDDPIPPSPGIEPRVRLHDAIKNLNLHQKNRLIRFRGNGRGSGIRWEAVAQLPRCCPGASPVGCE